MRRIHAIQGMIPKDSLKKDPILETTEIRGLTLMFDNPSKELKWQATQLKRNVGLTQRFLFFSAIFQGIFYWSDVIENINDVNTQSLSHLLYLRIILVILPLSACFLVSTGLLVPTQTIIFWITMCYGLPTLAIFYLSRKVLSHW